MEKMKNLPHVIIQVGPKTERRGGEEGERAEIKWSHCKDILVVSDQLLVKLKLQKNGFLGGR